MYIHIHGHIEATEGGCWVKATFRFFNTRILWLRTAPRDSNNHSNLQEHSQTVTRWRPFGTKVDIFCKIWLKMAAVCYKLVAECPLGLLTLPQSVRQFLVRLGGHRWRDSATVDLWLRIGGRKTTSTTKRYLHRLQNPFILTSYMDCCSSGLSITPQHEFRDKCTKQRIELWTANYFYCCSTCFVSSCVWIIIIYYYVVYVHNLNYATSSSHFPQGPSIMIRLVYFIVFCVTCLSSCYSSSTTNKVALIMLRAITTT